MRMSWPFSWHTRPVSIWALGNVRALADADGPRNASPQDQLLHRLGRHPNITEEVQ